MKNLILTIILINVFACTKTEVQTGINEDVIGSWSWTLTSGGIAGINETPQNTLKEIDFIFTSTHLSTYLNDTLQSTRAYSIQLAPSIPENMDSYEITIGNNSQAIIVKENLLTIRDFYDDGYQYDYTKK